MNIYYTAKAVISLTRDYRVNYELDGVEHTEDFSFSFRFSDPVEDLKQLLEKRFGNQINLMPSEFQRKLNEHVADPKNWPSEDDYCPCCGK